MSALLPLILPLLRLLVAVLEFIESIGGE